MTDTPTPEDEAFKELEAKQVKLNIEECGIGITGTEVVNHFQVVSTTAFAGVSAEGVCTIDWKLAEKEAAKWKPFGSMSEAIAKLLMFAKQEKTNMKPDHVNETSKNEHDELTEEMVIAAARVLNESAAQSCNVDAEDQWRWYSEEFKKRRKKCT